MFPWLLTADKFCFFFVGGGGCEVLIYCDKKQSGFSNLCISEKLEVSFVSLNRHVPLFKSFSHGNWQTLMRVFGFRFDNHIVFGKIKKF